MIISNLCLVYFAAEKRHQEGGVCAVYRCVLKLTKFKKTEAAMKVLKPEFHDQYLKVRKKHIVC